MENEDTVAVKLYIAYGTASDQVTALRLQALGAVNGLTVYVPPAYSRTSAPASLDSQSEANLRAADVVLGVVTIAISEACRKELHAAKALGKSTIVMAGPVVAPQLEPYFPGKVLVLNPSDPPKQSWALFSS